MQLELAYYSMPESKAGYYSIVHHKFSLLMVNAITASMLIAQCL